MRIEILDEAQQDLIDSFRFYENQTTGTVEIIPKGFGNGNFRH